MQNDGRWKGDLTGEFADDLVRFSAAKAARVCASWALQSYWQSLAHGGSADTPETLLPVPVREKKFQPHEERSAFSLLKMDHAGKAAKTALKRPHINALVGRPLFLRQDAGAVKAHVACGCDLVGDEIQAHQRYAHFQRYAVLGTARRARNHLPSERRGNRRRPSDREDD